MRHIATDNRYIYMIAIYIKSLNISTKSFFALHHFTNRNIKLYYYCTNKLVSLIWHCCTKRKSQTSLLYFWRTYLDNLTNDNPNCLLYTSWNGRTKHIHNGKVQKELCNNSRKKQDWFKEIPNIAYEFKSVHLEIIVHLEMTFLV